METLSEEEKKEFREVFPLPLKKGDIFPRGMVIRNCNVYPGIVELKIETTGGFQSHHGIKCPVCGRDDLTIRGRASKWISDLPYLGRAVREKLYVPEYRCNTCQRPSFAVSEVSGFLESRCQMTQRLKDFTVLLEACTSAEAAARILQYLDTEISGDTVKRIVDDYKMRNDSVWVLGKEEFGEIRESRCSDASVEFYGDSLGYYMEPEVLSMDAQTRLDAMQKLLQIVFVEKRPVPEMEKDDWWKERGLPVFTWK